MMRNSQKLLHYVHLLRLHRPIGILLLLWPTLWALWLANQGHPPLHLLIIFILGVIIMRSAGCVINDYADRDFDACVVRTQTRPLAIGVITKREALTLFSGLIIVAFILVLFLNFFTIKLSIVGLLLAIIYPYTKRYTYWPQLVLGCAFAWAIPMVYAASLNELPLQTWLVFLAAVLWPLAYDTLYAMTDRVDDVKVGIKSTAILWGNYARLIVGLIQVSVLLLLAFVGWQIQLSQYFYISLLISVLLFLYQQRLIVQYNPAQCFRAFKNNNWVGLIIFLGILLGYAYKQS